MKGAVVKTWTRKKKIDPSIQGAVCVIDGDQGIRNSLFMLLGTIGVRAVTFSTAEEFLDRVSGERPAFLITELALPGMGGFELRGELERKGIRIPLIGLTGEADRQKRREAARLGFLDLVEKPFVYWSVVERVQQTLGLAC
jgi:two-component system response regulator FixJ